MAIQPNISLAVETPQVPDQTETLAKAFSIRGMRQQYEAGAQHLEQGALELEQQKQAMAEQRLVGQLWAKHKGDISAIAAEAAGQVRPQTLMGLQKSALDHDTAVAGLKEK